MDNHSQPIDNRSDGRHEPNTVSVRGVLLSGLGFSLLLVLALSLMVGMFRALIVLNPEPNAKPTLVDRANNMAGPRLNADQPRLLSELRQLEEKRLGSYEWIDEKTGVARIPIDRAIEILATKGLQPNEPKQEQRDDKEKQ